MIFAYHGYPWLIHRLTYRRTNHDNIHVRGYKEEGTTTTPFDMVMLNDLDRFHTRDGRDRPRPRPRRASRARCARRWSTTRLRHRAYTREDGDDPPEIRDWRWPRPAGMAAAPVSHPPASARPERSGAGPDVNAGSSSLKLALLDAGDERVAARELHAPRARIDDRRAADALSAGLADADAVGASHRPRRRALHARPVVIDADVERRCASSATSRRCTSRSRSAALDAVAARCPSLPAVACFDTAFHATLPPAA